MKKIDYSLALESVVMAICISALSLTVLYFMYSILSFLFSSPVLLTGIFLLFCGTSAYVFYDARAFRWNNKPKALPTRSIPDEKESNPVIFL